MVAGLVLHGASLGPQYSSLGDDGSAVPAPLLRVGSPLRRRCGSTYGPRVGRDGDTGVSRGIFAQLQRSKKAGCDRRSGCVRADQLRRLRPDRVLLCPRTSLETETFFRESFRALRHGGVLGLTTVSTHQKHGSPRDYFRFTDDCLVMLARDAGYEVETTALLTGPGQCIASLLSSFLVLPWIRIVALLAARASDWLIKRVLPSVQENWCAGYVVVARKPLETLSRKP